MQSGIAASALYVYAMFGMIVWRWKTVERQANGKYN